MTAIWTCCSTRQHEIGLLADGGYSAGYCSAQILCSVVDTLLRYCALWWILCWLNCDTLLCGGQSAQLLDTVSVTMILCLLVDTLLVTAILCSVVDILCSVVDSMLLS